MASDWAAGLGSRNRAYGENSDQVADIRRNERDFERVDWARKSGTNSGSLISFNPIFYGDCARQYIRGSQAQL
jgi:hypothetical protein